MLCLFLLYSRVHISKSALEHLGDSYVVEDGHGGERDQFLADNQIETFLIVGRKKKEEVRKAGSLRFYPLFFGEKFTKLTFLTKPKARIFIKP